MIPDNSQIMASYDNFTGKCDTVMTQLHVNILTAAIVIFSCDNTVNKSVMAPLSVILINYGLHVFGVVSFCTTNINVVFTLAKLLLF